VVLRARQPDPLAAVELLLEHRRQAPRRARVADQLLERARRRVLLVHDRRRRRLEAARVLLQVTRPLGRQTLAHVAHHFFPRRATSALSCSNIFGTLAFVSLSSTNLGTRKPTCASTS